MSRTKIKYPNPAFFRAKDNMDWKKQGENLLEVGSIIVDMFKETDWKKYGNDRLNDLKDDGRRIAEEFKAVMAMSPEERKDLLINGEKRLGKLYRKGAMATVRREWRGVKDTAYDYKEWLRM